MTNEVCCGEACPSQPDATLGHREKRATGCISMHSSHQLWEQHLKHRKHIKGIERLESRRLLSADLSTHTLHGGVSPIRYSRLGDAYFHDAAEHFTGAHSDDLAAHEDTTAPAWSLLADEPTDSMSLPSPPAQSVPLSDLPNLHSNPDTVYKIYLDFDGQIVSGTRWNTDKDIATIHAPPFDLDNDITGFNDAELTRIERVWERVAEDFSGFDVDVTTEEPPASSFTSRRAIRILISTNVDDARVGGTGDDWYGSAGGVAYVGSFSWRSDTPAWVFHKKLGSVEKSIAEAASHEAGHTFGLQHDGIDGGTAYYAGHGSGETGWAPIMGVGYDRNLSQWSRGEYADANNSTQDDVALIASRVGFRPDDHSNERSLNATPLDIETGLLSASGIIETRTDIDTLYIDMGLSTGLLNLEVKPFSPGPNLDISVSLYDSNDQLISESNPLNLLSASVNEQVGPGVYYIVIDGVGRENGITGYTDYASLGQFNLEGTLQLDAPEFVPGDLNGDDLVDASDAGLIGQNWGALPAILPGEAPDGTAIASYNEHTGEVVVSASNVNSWFIESPEGGLTGSSANILPNNGGIVTDKDDRVGELAVQNFSFTNLSLGPIGATFLNDLRILYTPGISIPMQEGELIEAYPATEAAPGTAKAVYNYLTGEVAVSANGVTSWSLSSDAGGLVGIAPSVLPAAPDGVVTDTNETIAEAASDPFTYTNLQLGRVAATRLPDMRFSYQVSPTTPPIQSGLLIVGLGDYNLDGYIDASDASFLFSNWTADPVPSRSDELSSSTTLASRYDSAEAVDAAMSDMPPIAYESAWAEEAADWLQL